MGKEFNIEVSGNHGIISFPAIPKDFIEDSKNKGRSILCSPENIDINLLKANNIYWGSMKSWPNGKSFVSTLAVRFEFSGDKLDIDVANKIYKTFPHWINRFKNFTEIVTGQDMDGYPIRKDKYEDIKLWTWDGKGKRKTPHTVPYQITMFLSKEDNSLNSEYLQKILEFTSLEKQTRLEYSILKDARKAMLRRDFRKTIIDAASVVERLLTKKEKELLEKNNSKDFADAILKKYQALGNRLTLANVLNIELPNHDYQKDLVKPRNECIHKGFYPEGTDAEKAYNIAQDTLKWFKIPEVEE